MITAIIPNPAKADGQPVSTPDATPSVQYLTLAELLYGFDVEDDPNTLGIEMPNLTTADGDLIFIRDGYSSYSFPKLATVGNDLTFQNLIATGPLNMAALTTVTGVLSVQNCSFNACNFPLLNAVTGDDITLDTIPGNVTLPALLTIRQLTIKNMTGIGPLELTSLYETSWEVLVQNCTFSSYSFPALTAVGNDLTFSGCSGNSISLPVMASFSASSLIVQNCTIPSFSAPELTYIDQQFIWTNNAVVDLTLPKLDVVGVIEITNDNVLQTFSAPLSVGIVDHLTLSALPALTTFNMPAVGFFANALAISQTGLTALSLPGTTSAGAVTVTGNTSLASVTLATMGTISSADFSANGTQFTSFSAPLWVPTDGSTISFAGNGLDVTSVNHILALCVAASMTSGSIDLSGGTNAVPTGQGATDVTTLTNAGVSVSVNS